MRDLLRLTRPVDFVLFVAAVLLGGWLAAGALAFEGEAGRRLLIAAFAAACVGVAANVVNDVYDVEIDRRNGRDRPLPTGRVSPRAAWTLWGALSVVGVAFGFLASPVHGAIAAGAALLVWLYAAYLKAVPGVGHLIVGGVVGVGVLYGAMAAGPALAASTAAGAGAALACVLVAAREVVKAIPDIEGDRAEGARTLPVVLGPRRASWVALGAIVLVVALLPLVPLAGFDPLVVAYVVPMAACLLAAVWALLATDAIAAARPSAWAAGARRASAWMKAALALGVLALALGR